MAARQETLCPSDPKDLRVLQMLENCCRKNTRPTIGKMMVISRWIVRLKTPENTSALVECCAAGRLNVRDTFSRRESLYAQRNRWFAQMAFWEKDWQRNEGEGNNGETMVFGLMNNPCHVLALLNWPLASELPFFSQKMCKRERMSNEQCLSLAASTKTETET